MKSFYSYAFLNSLLTGLIAGHFLEVNSLYCGELLITECNGNSAQHSSVGNQYDSKKNHKSLADYYNRIICWC